jgi:hypothetical protein
MSGGTFSKSARPERPGVYTNFESVSPTTILPSAGSVVAIPFTHTWGPFKEVQLLSSYSEYLSLYGPDDTEGARAVKTAFLGEGLPGRGGAGAVLAYRFGQTTAAKATLVLKNGAAEATVTVTAKYIGTRGNELKITTRDHAADTTKNEFLVFLGTTLLETYVYTDAVPTNLVEQINANSKWLTAAVNKAGAVLANITTTALAGGIDGTAPKKADWAAMLTAMSTQRFGLIAPYNLVTAQVADGTASEIMTTMATWIAEMNTTGHRTMLVVGGELNEEVLSANTRAALFNNPNVVNVGFGSVTDELPRPLYR